MSEKEYITGLGFVAGVLSEGIETLPEYHVEPKDTCVTEVQQPQVVPVAVSSSSQARGSVSKQSE